MRRAHHLVPVGVPRVPVPQAGTQRLQPRLPVLQRAKIDVLHYQHDIRKDKVPAAECSCVNHGLVLPTS